MEMTNMLLTKFRCIIPSVMATRTLFCRLCMCQSIYTSISTFVRRFLKGHFLEEWSAIFVAFKTKNYNSFCVRHSTNLEPKRPVSWKMLLRIIDPHGHAMISTFFKPVILTLSIIYFTCSAWDKNSRHLKNMKNCDFIG